MLVTWSKQMETGIGAIDTQHRSLVDIVNQLHTAMKEGRAKDKIAGVVKELVRYTEYHFNAEESLLQRHAFPELDAHKKTHRGFVEQLEKFVSDAESKKISLSVDVLRFLSDWLVKHIQGRDQEYATYLHRKGVS